MNSNLPASPFKATPFYLFCILLSIYSLYHFFEKSGSAFEWPALDMGPFLERSVNNNFIPNDFFTNTSSDISPRQIYGQAVLFLAKIFNTDWYSIFFALELIYSFFIPSFIFLLFYKFFKDKIQNKKQNFAINVFLLISCFLLLRQNFAYFFSIAWWPPLTLTATSQNFSLLLFLLGALFLLYGKSKFKNLFLIFWFLSTLVHFSMGIFLIFFYFISTVPKYTYMQIITSVIVCILSPVAILFLFFTPGISISTSDFIHIYIGRHSKHYIINELGSLTPYPWWLSFLLIVLLLLVAFGIGWKMRNKELKLRSVLFLIAYFGCILMQYIVVEIIPTKFLAALGPIRFSFLGLWMVIVLYTHLIVLSVDSLWKIFAEYCKRFKLHRLKRNLYPFISNSYFFNGVSFYLLGISLILANFWLNKNDPYSDLKSKYESFYAWVKNETSPDAVFAVSMTSDLAFQIPLVGKRAIFIGNGFPFNEQFFKEYYNRHSLLYGSYELHNSSSLDIYERSNLFYEQLKPKDFIRISKNYKLDYIIFEKNKGKKFDGVSPIFNNDKIKVYKISNLIGKDL